MMSFGLFCTGCGWGEGGEVGGGDWSSFIWSQYSPVSLGREVRIQTGLVHLQYWMYHSFMYLSMYSPM